MKEASRLAARTLVVWELTITAPLTITSASSVVSSSTCTSSDRGNATRSDD